MIRLGTDIVYIPRFRQPLIVLAIVLQRVYTLNNKIVGTGKLAQSPLLTNWLGAGQLRSRCQGTGNRVAGVATPILRFDASPVGPAVHLHRQATAVVAVWEKVNGS